MLQSLSVYNIYHSFQLNLFQFSFIYIMPNQTPQGALYCKVNLYNNTKKTPFEQALGNSGKEKLLFNRKKPLWHKAGLGGASIMTGWGPWC